MTWPVLISVAISACAVAFSIYTFTATRKTELAWKRTEFLFTQAQYLDTDSELIDAVKILEGRYDGVTISQIFDADHLDAVIKNEYLKKIDKLLNFLWRLGYAYLETKTITKSDIEGFGWYFRRIAQLPCLIKYCDENGYEEIKKVLDKLGYLQAVKVLPESPPN